MVASRAQSRGSEHARRLKILLDTAVRVQTVSDRSAVMDALTSGASDLLRDQRVRLRTDPPSSTEIGVPVHGSGEDLWVVGPALNRARSTADDDRQGLTALVAVAEDAFARLRLSEDMAHLAWHDPLTGLPNRSLFMDRVEHAMAMQARRGGQLAVLFCDLDGFKRVNDLFGHAAGDELLVEVGQPDQGHRARPPTPWPASAATSSPSSSRRCWTPTTSERPASASSRCCASGSRSPATRSRSPPPSASRCRSRVTPPTTC